MPPTFRWSVGATRNYLQREWGHAILPPTFRWSVGATSSRGWHQTIQDLDVPDLPVVGRGYE